MNESRLDMLLRLIDPDPGVEVLIDVDDLPELTQYVEGTDPYLAERASALISLVNDDAAIPALDQALKSPHEQARIAAAAGLWRPQSNPEAAFHSALQDSAPAVRRFALRSLGRRITEYRETPPEGLVEDVVRAADEDTDPGTRAIANVLQLRVSDESIDAAAIRRALARGASPTDLAMVVGRDADAALEKAAASKDSDVAAGAVEVAIAVSEDTAASAINEAKSHDDPHVRRSVARALQQKEQLDEDRDTVAVLLEDPEAEVRREALVAATRGLDEELEAKVRRLAERDSDAGVRSLASEVLERRRRG